MSYNSPYLPADSRAAYIYWLVGGVSSLLSDIGVGVGSSRYNMGGSIVLGTYMLDTTAGMKKY